CGASPCESRSSSSFYPKPPIRISGSGVCLCALKRTLGVRAFTGYARKKYRVMKHKTGQAGDVGRTATELVRSWGRLCRHHMDESRVVLEMMECQAGRRYEKRRG